MRFIIKDNTRKKNSISYISNLPENKTWLVDISEYKPKRTLSQNRLYFLWLNAISDHTGHTKDELHERFALKLLGTVERTVKYRDDKNVIHRVALTEIVSTASLKTKEFAEYLTLVEATVTMAFPDLMLPYPDDKHYALGGDKP